MRKNAQMWLKIVHEYLDGKEPMTVLCRKYKVDLSKLKYRAETNNFYIILYNSQMTHNLNEYSKMLSYY